MHDYELIKYSEYFMHCRLILATCVIARQILFAVLCDFMRFYTHALSTQHGKQPCSWTYKVFNNCWFIQEQRRLRGREKWKVKSIWIF